MTRYLECWAPAAEQLAVELRGPLSVDLPNGESVEAQLHVPYFGAEKGMLIFERILSNEAFRSLVELGYGYSVFAEPSAGETSNADDVADVLRDWGWCGPQSKAPDWL